jgi:hypothetical protein
VPSKINGKKIPKDKYKDYQPTKLATECEIIIDNINKPINKIETKDLYRHLVTKKSKRPTIENKWKENQELDADENDWENIYTSAFKLTKDTKIQTPAIQNYT